MSNNCSITQGLACNQFTLQANEQAENNMGFFFFYYFCLGFHFISTEFQLRQLTSSYPNTVFQCYQRNTSIWRCFTLKISPTPKKKWKLNPTRFWLHPHNLYVDVCNYSFYIGSSSTPWKPPLFQLLWKNSFLDIINRWFPQQLKNIGVSGNKKLQRKHILNSD